MFNLISTWGIQIKTTLSYQISRSWIKVTIISVKGSCGTIKTFTWLLAVFWYNTHSGKTLWHYLIKLMPTLLSYIVDPANILLKICLPYSDTCRHAPEYLQKECSHQHLLATAKTQKQLCCCCYVTSVVSDLMWPHRRQPIRLRRPWDSPGKNNGVEKQP